MSVSLYTSALLQRIKSLQEVPDVRFFTCILFYSYCSISRLNPH